MLSVLSVLSVPSVGSVGKFSNNKIGGVVSVLLLCLMTAKYVLQGTVRFVGIILVVVVGIPRERKMKMTGNLPPSHRDDAGTAYL